MTIAHETTFSNRVLAASQVINWRNLPVMILLGIGAIFMLLPFLWMFATSMRPASEAYQLPPSFLPSRLNFDAYWAVLDSPIPFLRMYFNSFVVAVATTIGTIVTSAMAAFAFSRLRFPGNSWLFGFMLLGLMVPPALIVIPLFFGMAAAGLLDSLWSLILPALASPLAVFMMRQFMEGQPREYEEAAFVDGASYWTIFWRISLPQMGPPIAALSIIVFTSSWNNFLLPLIFVRKFETMTLPVGMVALSDNFGSLSLAAIMAAVTMCVLPLLVVFLIAQRFIVESITSTGIKR
ncbi:carbohydrate ABC transporter permease [Devosia lacusdianchii]|jgi:multiple sugar transport system permease protein|uniref:carbohydrate ABC transporter permease n=1 Tax=Devosia lacusdianchii TaxID=2917991 RepID=UPI001F0615A1|nr:carbohydrate ABC transporter permease [Devosia sp. JXJ CY 41]